MQDEPRAVNAEAGERLSVILRLARQRWPGVRVQDADFASHLALHLPEGATVPEAIEGIFAEDLFLAFACARGDPVALEAFNREILGDVGAFVASVDRSPAFADEVRQALRDRLLTAVEGAPRIAEYSGRGALGGWVRVAALRVALNLQRGERRAARAARTQGESPLAEGLSPELLLLKERYKSAFADALRAAVTDLSERDRVLLRLYHVDDLSLEAIGALYRVHLSTVSRWLTCARHAVAEGTTRRLTESLRVNPSEVDSIAALVMSQVDVSLTRLLGGP